MVIGKLNVLLGLNSSKFNSGMDGAAKKTKATGSKMQSFVAVGKKMAIGLAAVGTAAIAAATAVVKFTASVTAGIDSTFKYADQIGMNVNHLRDLEYAFGQAGIAGDKTRSMLTRLTKRTAEFAQRGTGPAAKGLEELGFSMQELKGMKPEELFETVFKAIEKLPTEADQARISMEIFGDAGLEMTKLLAGGWDGVTEAMDRNRKLATRWDDEDKARAADVQDRLDDMSRAWDDVKQQLALDFAPAVIAALESITAAAKVAGKWLRDVAEVGKFILTQETTTPEIVGATTDAQRKRWAAERRAQNAAANAPAAETFIRFRWSSAALRKSAETFQGRIAELQARRDALGPGAADIPGYAVGAGRSGTLSSLLRSEARDFAQQDPRVAEQKKTNDLIKSIDDQIAAFTEEYERLQQRAEAAEAVEAEEVATIP